MNELPKRKNIRIEHYDYSAPGAYFVTICTKNREKIFWDDCRGELCSPADAPLTNIGAVVDREIQKLNTLYDAVRIDTYCIMPDHIHFIITISADENGRTQFAPTISRIVKQFKGAITKKSVDRFGKNRFMTTVFAISKITTKRKSTLKIIR